MSGQNLTGSCRPFKLPVPLCVLLLGAGTTGETEHSTGIIHPLTITGHPLFPRHFSLHILDLENHRREARVCDDRFHCPIRGDCLEPCHHTAL